MARHYKLNGKAVEPCGAGECHSLYKQEVFRTKDRAIEVVTEFVGIDQRWDNSTEPLPLVFQSVVSGGALHGHRLLTSTWRQAEMAHRIALAAARLRANG